MSEAAYANVYFKTICNVNVYVKSIFMGSRSTAGVPLSQAAPAFLITAPMCVPAVLGALAVWRLSKKKKTGPT